MSFDEFLMKNFVKIASNHRIIRFYLLPLIEFDTEGFQEKHIKDVCINKSGTHIYIRFPVFANEFERRSVANPNFLFRIEVKDKYFTVFKVPHIYIPEIHKIINGELTTLLPSTKEKIIALSGLPFNKRQDGLYITHLYLQALFKDNPLKLAISEYLGVPVHCIKWTEVIAKIPEDSAIFIENWE